MATVTNQDGKPVSREEQIEVLIAAGISREYAEFVVAMEAGEVDGDVVVLEDTNENGS